MVVLCGGGGDGGVGDGGGDGGGGVPGASAGRWVVASPSRHQTVQVDLIPYNQIRENIDRLG